MEDNIKSTERPSISRDIIFLFLGAALPFLFTQFNNFVADRQLTDQLAKNILLEIQLNHKVITDRLPIIRGGIRDFTGGANSDFIKSGERFDDIYKIYVNKISLLDTNLAADIILYYENLILLDSQEVSLDETLNNFNRVSQLASKANVLNEMNEEVKLLEGLMRVGAIVQAQLITKYNAYRYDIDIDAEKMKLANTRITSYISNKKHGDKFSLQDVVEKTQVEEVTAAVELLNLGIKINYPAIKGEFIKP